MAAYVLAHFRRAITLCSCQGIYESAHPRSDMQWGGQLLKVFKPYEFKFSIQVFNSWERLIDKDILLHHLIIE